MEQNFMNFSQALQVMKEGRKVDRMDWEGQGLWITFLAEQNVFAAHINGYWQLGWLPITPDVLANDWREVQADVEYSPDAPQEVAPA